MFRFQHFRVCLHKAKPYLTAVHCNWWPSGVVKAARRAQVGPCFSVDVRKGRQMLWSQHLKFLIIKSKIRLPKQKDPSWLGGKTTYDCSLYWLKYELPCDRFEFVEDDFHFMWQPSSWHLSPRCAALDSGQSKELRSSAFGCKGAGG